MIRAVRSASRLRRLLGGGLALGVLLPALALAQAGGGAGVPGSGVPGAGVPGAGPERLGDGGSLIDRDGVRTENFRTVPRDAEGKLREYEPPTLPRQDMVDAAHARLRMLDKMTGQVETVEMDAGETIVEARLELALKVCRVPVGDDRGDAVAYLEIRDLRDDAPRFEGWMFAASPALSALDHARYDVWVESCSTSAASGASGKE